MGRAWSTPVWGLLLLGTVLSGCLSEAELDLEGVAAPHWEPGFHWAYAVEAEGEAVRTADGSRSVTNAERDGRVNMTVRHTSTELAGGPAYVLEQESPLSGQFGAGVGLFGRAGIVALSQETLQPVARHMRWLSDADCVPLLLAAVEEPPVLPFPLATGSVVSGESRGLAYQVEVIGTGRVDTPAGEFEAVHLRLSLAPLVDETAPDTLPSGFRLLEASTVQDYWFAPAAHNVVKAVTFERHVYEHAGTHVESEATTTVRLVHMSLVAGDEDPAPLLRDTDGVFPDRLRITTDTGFPYNVADGATTARFGVEHVGLRRPATPISTAPDEDASRHRTSGPEEEGFRLVDAVPDVADYDHDRYLVRWTVAPLGSGELVHTTGDVLELPIDGAGAYRIEVEMESVVQPGEARCDTPWMIRGAGAVATAFWEGSFTFSADGGFSHEFDVGSFPLAAFAELVAGWDLDSDHPVHDAGHLVVVGPDGTRHAPDNPEGRTLRALVSPEHDTESWRLVWRADGPRVLDQPGPFVLGHDVTLDVRVEGVRVH